MNQLGCHSGHPFIRALRSPCVWRYLVGAVLLLPVSCLATEVRLVAVTPGRSAAVAIEGGAPITVGVGETVEGVKRPDRGSQMGGAGGITTIKLLKADHGSAVLSIDGITKTLPLVADSAPVRDA